MAWVDEYEAKLQAATLCAFDVEGDFWSAHYCRRCGAAIGVSDVQDVMAEGWEFGSMPEIVDNIFGSGYWSQLDDVESTP